MRTRRIFVSASAAARLAAARQILAALTGGIVIAPTRGAADDFVRRYAHEAGGLVGLQRMTLTQVAAELAREDLAPVGGLAIEALAARTIFRCRQERCLDYFEPVAETPGFRKALASTLSELRMAGIAPDDLRAAGAPGTDLSRLLAGYQRELQQRALADLAALYALAAGRARRVPLFLLDLRPESAAEQRLLAALVKESPVVCATAPLGDDEGIRTLERLLEARAEILEAPDGNSLGRLRAHLFSLDRPAYAELDSSVEFFSAGGEALECVEIARRLRSFADGGVTFDRMAVLLRDADRYLPLMEDALRRAGIPAYFTRGVLRPDPTGRAFLALLECGSEGLSAARFAEYLSLGQVPAQAAGEAWVPSEDEVHSAYRDDFTEPAPEPADSRMETEDQPVIAGSLRAPAAWEKLLVEAAVIGGRQRWARRLRGLEAEYELQLGEVEDEAQRTRIARQLMRLRTLAAFALPLIARLDSLPESARWSEWLSALAGLAGAALRDPEPVLSVLSELEAMGEVGPVGLDEVRSVLVERLRFLRREPPPRRYGCVFVGSVAEAAGRTFDVVFLPGLAEGIFPRKTAEDPLLLDTHRARWPTLVRQKDRAARERLLLRTAAGAAERVFVTSYPRLDLAQGRARVPSFYALEVLRAAEGRLPDLREIEKRAARASTTRLGWPAPQQPAQAIDDAEYDLAVLEPLQFRRPEKAKGYGCYLLTASPTLARALRTRGRRWRATWYPADGLVDPQPAALAALAAHSLAARSYSPSSLQHFAACPYRFLLYAIHQLRPREEALPLEQLDPLTRGALFHEAQREILGELGREQLLPLDAPQTGAALDIADRALARVAAEYEETLAPAIPQVWDTEINAIRIDLRAWILQLPAIHANWQPLHSEFAFGLPADASRDPASTPREAVIADGFRLRGSIDLVEQNRANGRLRVTDHKTGRVPASIPVATGGGRILQPVLYGLAAEQLLEAPVEDGMLFYCTQRGNFTQIRIRLDDRARAAAHRVLEIVEAAIRAGFLPAAPAAGDCAWCDYASVCGPYEELRVKKKRPERLEPLEALRMLP